jgi:hypothetical protein
MPEQTSAIHEDFGRQHEVSRSSDRSVGLVLGAVLLAIATYRGFATGGVSLGVTIWAVFGIGLVVLALRSPRFIAPLSALWMAIGHALSKIANPVVLGILFYLVFVPCGILMRILGQDLLRLKLDPAAGDYWIERDPPGPAPNKMRHQY